MTEEQIKQKAEIQTKYWKEQNNCIQAYIAGYHECQKEHEWHYVKNGDLPKDENKVWLCFGTDDYSDGQFIRGRFWCDSCGWFDVEEVIAWQTLVPPKEIE